MSADRLQIGLQHYELTQERKRVLNSLESLLGRATRAKIQNLLRLPDAIRSRHIDDNPVYRAAIKQLMEQYLVENDEKDKPERRELMRKIIESISEVERITAELEAMKRENNSSGNSSNGNKAEKVRKVG